MIVFYRPLRKSKATEAFVDRQVFFTSYLLHPLEQNYHKPDQAKAKVVRMRKKMKKKSKPMKENQVKVERSTLGLMLNRPSLFDK